MFSSIEENFKYFNDNKIIDLFQFIDSNLEKELSNRVLCNHLNISRLMEHNFKISYNQKLHDFWTYRFLCDIGQTINVSTFWISSSWKYITIIFN